MIGDTLAELAVKITADSKELTKGLGDAEKKMASFSDGILKHSKAIGASMMAIGGAIVGAAVLSIKSYAKMGSEIHDLALKTGFATETLSELSYMAKQSGTSLGALEVGIKRMQSTLYDAKRGMQGAKDSLAALGLTFEELEGLKPEEQFWKITSALAEIPDPTIKAALAVDLFGRSGTDLLPILAEGASGIEAMKQKAKELGIVFDAEAAAKADKLGDAMDNLEQSTMGLKIAVAEAITPAVQKLAEDMTKIIQKVMEWAKANPELVNTILKVGIALIGAGGLLFAITKIIAIVRAMAAAFAVAQAFMGPGGWAALAISGAAAAAAIYAINQMTKGTPETSGFIFKGAGLEGYQYGGIVPGGIGKPQLAMVHGGETIIPPGEIKGINVIVNVAGSVVTERDLAQTIRRELLIIQDRNYSTGIA